MKPLLRFCLCLGFLVPGAPAPAPAAEESTLFLMSLDNLGWKRLDSYGPDNPWDSVPREMQKFGGIPFLLTTKMQFHGTGDARDNRFYPSHVTGLTVGQRAARLHLIHGANMSETTGKPIAAIRLNYVDKHSHTLLIHYGVHTRDWWKHKDEKDDSLSDTNSAVAWVGKSVDAEKIGATHRLFKTTFELPPSPHALETIDVFSLFGRSAFILVGLTVEGPGASEPKPASAPDAAPSADLAKFRRQLEVDVTAIDGGLLDGARLKGTSMDERNAITLLGRMDDTRGDAGIVVVDFPANARRLQLVASTRNRGPATLELNPGPDGNLPTKAAVRLGMSKRIVGTVVKPDGQPLSKAKVTVLERARSATGAMTEIKLDELTSDSQGQWKAQFMAESASNLVFRVTHVNYWPSRYQVSDKAGKETLALSEILAGEAQLQMAPTLKISGVVKDPSGKPIPRTSVQLAYGISATSTFTDDKGQFSIGRRDPGIVTLIVQRPEFAPFIRELTLDNKSLSVDVTLESGKPFIGRVVEWGWETNLNETKPLAGVNVVVTSPIAQQARWSGKTDSAGRFVWENAPAGPLKVQASLGGYIARTFTANRNDASPPNPSPANEAEFALGKSFFASGTVVDAKSKKPIAEFIITPGQKSSTSRTFWHPAQSSKGNNGEFLLTQTSGYSVNQGVLKVEAPGYEPQLFRTEDFGWRSNRIELRPGANARFAVKRPDGKPAADAYVGVVGEGSLSLMADPRLGPRLLGTSGLIVKSDAEGRVQLAPHLSPRVVIVHMEGYTETTFSNLLAQPQVTLQAWGEIEGAVRIGAQPAPAADLRLTESRTLIEILYTSGFQTKADAEGKFHFRFVPPGNRLLSRQLRDQSSSGYQTMVKVEAGNTLNTVLGGTGRPVIGRVAAEDKTRAINWTNGIHRLNTVPAQPLDTRPGQDFQQWFNSPEVAAARDALMTYPIVFANDGSFRADDVPAGRYRMYLNFYARSQSGVAFGSQAGWLNHEFEIAPMQGGRTDDPLDLGTLQLTTPRVLEAER